MTAGDLTGAAVAQSAGLTRPPPVLLLHGQPGGAIDWDGVIARLPGATRVIAIDRPGWDGSGPAVGLAGNARAAVAALDRAGAGRAVVVGHSLGGAIAAWLAAVAPDRVEALILAAPAANVASLYPVDRWLAAPVAGELAGAITMGGLGAALSLPPLRRRIAIAAGLDERYLRAARRLALTPSAWRSYASEQRTLVRDLPALEELLPRIVAPTTILVGSGDRIVPPRAARALAAQISGARLMVSEQAGHLMPQCDPELVAEAILAALPA